MNHPKVVVDAVCGTPRTRTCSEWFDQPVLSAATRRLRLAHICSLATRVALEIVRVSCVDSSSAKCSELLGHADDARVEDEEDEEALEAEEEAEADEELLASELVVVL